MIQRRIVTRQCAGGIIKYRDITGRGVKTKNVQGELRFTEWAWSLCGLPGCMLDNNTITIPVAKCHAPLIPVRIQCRNPLSSMEPLTLSVLLL
jgi:hypothetical protein